MIGAKTYLRHGRPVRAFSPEEDALITDLRVAGNGTTEIAKRLRAELGTERTQATVNMRLKTLAVREEGA